MQMVGCCSCEEKQPGIEPVTSLLLVVSLQAHSLMALLVLACHLL